ncbi:hypothetical protein F5Y09DRAFT_131419 [Xylaria sp. FL1042]|nr:hypothetical protein F5Y09DRAFT_131419 [Xylaria sp. FL1042]
MEFHNGMNEVYRPDLGTQPVANIIFIHGLFGNPWKTFAATSREVREAIARDSTSSQYSSRKSKASRGIYWPRDLLPQSIHNTNVFSFGYDANVERFMSATGSNTVHHHGRNLLNALSDLLKEHGPLPLFIVAHSLGGLVIKEALNQSAHSCDVERSKVLQMTRGIIFLGTPHRGSSAATYGRVVFILTKIFAFQNANINLISSLKRGSDVLDRISTAFIETLMKAQNLKLWSFAEEKQMRLGLIGTHIVPHESAKIGHERENWGTISGDHRQIAKYLNADDEGFVKVSSVLKGWIDEAVWTVTEDRYLYEECLESLNDPEARLRIGEVSQVSRVNKGSFEWLFTDRAAYAEWLADDGSAYDPIFWITGKPGSGKSTLMRFALEDPRSKSLLPPSIGHPMAYFFHLRGKSLVQKSLQGMIQELLYQILKQFPDFYVPLKPIHERKIAKKSLGVKWDLDDLIEGFCRIPYLTALSMRGRPRIFLFIDALDENQDQNDNILLLQVLEGVLERYHVRKAQPSAPLLKICLASRPWPLFRSAFGGRSKILSISVNEFTTADIERYTQSLLLGPLSETQYSERYRRSVLDLAEQITSLAKGVFVWVRVVLENLHQHIVDGTPVNRLNDILRRYPTELDELYEYTIRRIPKEYQRETEVALKVVQQSRIQLNLGELYSICLICIGGASSHDTGLPDVPATWLSSRCGGLIEIVSRTESEPHRMDAEVQFIHQTVQEFVRQGIKGLSEELSTNVSLKISGSQFLAFACRFNQSRRHLGRVYKDTFGYLRDIEQAIDLAASPTPNWEHEEYQPVWKYMMPDGVSPRDVQDHQGNIFQDAFDLQAHHPLGYDMAILSGRFMHESSGDLDTVDEDELAFRRHCMPILQNLYHFGAKRGSHYYPVNFALVAALGLRLSTSRTDRPRMLSTVLSRHPDDANGRNRLDELQKFLVCDEFIPTLDLGVGITLITLLVSAIPNEHVEEDTLLKMSKIVLDSGVSTTVSVRIRLNEYALDLSLLNFVVRFKEGRRGAWIGLLRRYGARLHDEEFEWTNQRALSASLSGRNPAVSKISGEEEESISNAAVMTGLCLTNGMLRSQLLLRACFATGLRRRSALDVDEEWIRSPPAPSEYRGGMDSADDSIDASSDSPVEHFAVNTRPRRHYPETASDALRFSNTGQTLQGYPNLSEHIIIDPSTGRTWR